MTNFRCKASALEFAVDAIIFDLDGVLVDSRQVVERHWHKWCRAHHIPFPLPQEFMHGRRTLDVMNAIRPGHDNAGAAMEFDDKEGRDTTGLKPTPGARELVTRLPVDMWAIVTSCLARFATNRLRVTALPSPPILIGAEDVIHGKPSPDGFVLAAQLLRVPPENCLVVEDSIAGINAARAARMTVVALATTHDSARLEGADLIIDDLRQFSV